MTSKSSIIPLPSCIQKELQHVAAAVTYNLVMQTFDITNEKQKKLMDSYFHGDEDNMSQAELLATGEAGTVYQSLDEMSTVIRVDKTDKTGPTQKKLVFLSWEQNVDYFVGTNIKPEYIKAADCKIESSKMEGQCLHTMALEVAKKYKLAKSFAKEFLIEKGNIKDSDFQLPSSTTLEDVLKFVLDKMFALEESQKSKSKSEMTEPESLKFPTNYFFNGFFVFVLFGPFWSCDIDCLAFLEKDDKESWLMEIMCHHVMLHMNLLLNN